MTEATATTTGSKRFVVAQLGVVLVAWAAYRRARLVTVDELEAATANAADLLSRQARLGLDIEHQLQSWFLAFEPLVIAANWYYLVHFPVSIAVGVLAYRRSRRWFITLRDAALATTAVGLALHVAFPLAPPRLLDGFLDTGEVFGPSPYALPGSGAANQFAAMPSMHVAWAVLVGCVAWQLSSRRSMRIAAIAHPLITSWVVIVTANHYIADIAVGAALAGGTWSLRRRIRRPGEPVGPRHRTPDDLADRCVPLDPFPVEPRPVDGSAKPEPVAIPSFAHGATR